MQYNVTINDNQLFIDRFWIHECTQTNICCGFRDVWFYCVHALSSCNGERKDGMLCCNLLLWSHHRPFVCLFVSITGNAGASFNFSFTDFAMMGIQGRNYREHTMFPKISLSLWQLFRKMFLKLFSLLFGKHMLNSHVHKTAFVRSLSPQRWLSSPRWEGCSTQGSDWPTSPWVTASTWIPVQREEWQIICWPHFMTPFKHD